MSKKIFLVFQENNMEGIKMINTEHYEIVDDNCGEGYETHYEASRAMHECYKGRTDLTVKKDYERWYIVREKIKGVSKLK